MPDDLSLRTLANDEEQAVVEALRDRLSDDWAVFLDVALAMKRRDHQAAGVQAFPDSRCRPSAPSVTACAHGAPGNLSRKLVKQTRNLYTHGMFSNRSARTSTRERTQNRAALRDAMPGVIGLIVVEAILASVDLDADTNRWHLALALLPLLPTGWLVWAQLRSLRRADEYQRMMQLEAMAIGFGVAMLAALTGGLLDSAGVGSTAQWLQITFIGGVVSWVAALAFRSR